MKFSWKETVEAFSELYEIDLRGKINEFNSEEKIKSVSNPILKGYLSNSKYIDGVIKKAGVKLGKLDPIMRSILRISVSSVILGEDIPLSISRAIRIADRFASTNSWRFLHAALSKVVEDLKQKKEKQK